MVTVVIEEVADAPDSALPFVEPSGVSEREGLSSLLYMLDHPPTKDASIIADIDRMMEHDLFTDAMGRRLLAVRGHDVEDERLLAAQYLLDHTGSDDADEYFEIERPSWLPGRASNSALGVWLRELALGTDEPRPSYRVLPGGYVSSISYQEDEPVATDVDEDEADELGDDEDYLDWLGLQLLHCHSGTHPYIIDGVHESGDDTTSVYTLEASTFVSPILSTLTADDPDLEDLLGTSPNQRPRKSQRLQKRI